MNKGIIIGVAIAIVIGVIAITASSNNSGNTSEAPLEEGIKSEPKQFNVEISESIGFSGG